VIRKCRKTLWTCFAVILGVGSLYGCSRTNEPTPGTAKVQAADKAKAETATEEHTAPLFTVNELMVAIVDDSAHELWDLEKQANTPKSESDWLEIQHHAIQLAASGMLLELGGTGPRDEGWAKSPSWKKRSQELTTKALAARDAARAKKWESLMAVNGEITEACEGCHKEFKPSLPTEGLVHKEGE